MSIEVSYVSAACNHVPNIVHWGSNNLICYGACNSIFIYNPHFHGGKITHTLNLHTDRVNSVRWISGCAFEEELISASADKTAIIWSLVGGEYKSEVLSGHLDVVTAVDAVYKSHAKRHMIAATTSSDSTIRIWERLNSEHNSHIRHIFNLRYNIAVALRICLPFDSQNLLVVYGSNQNKIELFTETNGEFTKGPTLSGHEDWIRGLDFNTDGDRFLLASASQDHCIRIWQFVDASDPSIISQQVLHLGEKSLKVFVVSVLTGHEQWVYSVNWCRDKLLSASLDKSMIIWEYNEDAKMWLEADRVGNIGGNTLGFYGGLFSPDGNYILGHGYHGAFHLWKFDDEMASWQPEVTVGGHFKEVTDICWDPLGQYLMSVSADQTTRIHAPWRRVNPSTKEEVGTWHEIGRPQVHGFDLTCLAVIDHYRFASGAEEKVIRTFRAPEKFVDNIQRITGFHSNLKEYQAPKGASVPSLGLSNKAIYQCDNTQQALKTRSKKDSYAEESHFFAVTLNAPPTEDNLLQNTLWPEVQKLYAHGYELYALATSHNGKYLASSCKATTLEHAAIIIWDTTSWQFVQKLVSHTLTVVQLAFSPDDKYILSVSRDRRWTLFAQNEITGLFVVDAKSEKDKKHAVHTRIIWCCAWSHDSMFFATGSRDGKVAVWAAEEKTNWIGDTSTSQTCELASEVLDLNKESITALEFAKDFINNSYLVAVGLECGSIHLYKWNLNGFHAVITLDNRIAHHLTVKRLRFRPHQPPSGSGDFSSNFLQLASSSSDHSVRIYNVNLLH